MLKQFRNRVAWRHPEWWALSLSAAAWAAIVMSSTGVSGAVHHTAVEHLHADGAWSLFATHVGHWMLMVVAMMYPFTANALQTTAARSLWRRRHRAIASWLVGYSLPWLLLGIVAAWLVPAPLTVSTPALWIAVAFMVTAAWQATEARGRALNASHRTWPLAPAGWRATRDCLRSGWVSSTYCVAACGPLMIACSFLGHGPLGLTAMLGATAIALVERYAVRPDPRWLGAGVALLALVALTFA